MGLISNLLFGVRTLTQGSIPVPTRNTLEVEGAATLTDDSVNNRTIMAVGGVSTPATFATVSSGGLVLLGTTTNTNRQTFAPVAFTTSGAGLLNYATIPMVANMSASVDLILRGRLVLPTAGYVPTYFLHGILDVVWGVPGTTSQPVLLLFRAVDFDSTSVQAPFSTSAGTWPGSPTPGGSGSYFTGNNLILAVAGLTPTVARTTTQSVTKGEIVSNSGNTYIAHSNGTTGGGGGPSGTTDGQTDGSTSWDFVCTGTNVVINWTASIEVQPG